MLSTVAAIYAWDEVVGLGGVPQQGTGAEPRYGIWGTSCIFKA